MSNVSGAKRTHISDGENAEIDLLFLGNSPILHGVVQFHRGDRIEDVSCDVPELPGAYVIWGNKDGGRKRLYLGRGATAIPQDAASPKQTSGLRSEILNTCVDDQCHFDQLIESRGLDSLRIEWFATIRHAGDRRG